MNDGACPYCSLNDLFAMDDEGTHYIMCLTCRACGPTSDTRDDAMALWMERGGSDPDFSLSVRVDILPH